MNIIKDKSSEAFTQVFHSAVEEPTPTDVGTWTKKYFDDVPITVRVSPRKKDLSEEEKSAARRSVLLVS